MSFEWKGCLSSVKLFEGFQINGPSLGVHKNVDYLEGQLDFVSRSITPITHIVTRVILLH